MKAYEVREATDLDGLRLNGARPDPQPGHGQILVRMRAAALNYRDQGVIRGNYGYTKFPVIPLSDGAGEVAAVGPGVTQFKPGDRVASTFFVNWTGGQMPADASKNSLGGMIDGVLAEYALLAETGAIKFPDHLSFEEAATLPCAALTAWNALINTGRIKAGETVAILGTGGVSCFGLAFAKMHGAFVFLTSSSDEKLSRARALGADALVNYRAQPEWDQEILKQTGGAGVDHVLEVGGAGTLHTIVGEPAKKRLLIGIGGDAAALDEDMLDVDFGRWLAGEDLPVSHLAGQLGGMAKPFQWPQRRTMRRSPTPQPR